ncbi:MAG TPA: M14 family metallopeptidase [Acidobacteriaceae bacterium]|nr:M14 family metallopeptidase [Acidobacteriaceae bacterium]
MKAAQAVLEIDQFARGTKHRLKLEVDETTWLPVLLARGRSAGKIMAVTANIHGDEYEGVRALLDIFDALDPRAMSGDLIAVPVANPPAFWQGTRISPVDGLNMARIFPGNAEGTLSEKIAFAIAHSIISKADFYLDLHSGGITYSMPSMAGYCLTDPAGRASALAFGSRVIWGHSEIPAGRTISFAHSIGVPWLYTEARGAGRIHPEDLEMMTGGMRNLMTHLGILSGQIDFHEAEIKLRGDGNTDMGIRSSQAGFLLHKVSLLQEVRQGELLGTLVDLQGEHLEDYPAPKAGVVGMIREFPVVQPGDSLFLIADREP